MTESVCVCGCGCERECLCERDTVCICVCVFVCVIESVCVCGCGCERDTVCICVCVFVCVGKDIICCKQAYEHPDASREATVVLHVNDVNEPPQFLRSHYSASVSEGAELGDLFFSSIEAIDRDVVC